MGYALAVAAQNLNMEVSLISGPVNLRNPKGVQFVRIETALEMQVAMEAHFESADLIIMCVQRFRIIDHQKYMRENCEKMSSRKK